MDLEYIKEVVNNPKFNNSRFAKSLRKSLEEGKSPTPNQLIYILGNNAPNGIKTFEQQLGLIPKENKDELLRKAFGPSKVKKDKETEKKSEDLCNREERNRDNSSEIVRIDDVELIPTRDYKHWRYEFKHFNPVQTLTFPYIKLDTNIVISANTSSGKTACGELLIDNMFNSSNDNKLAIYICPMKSLSDERLRKWKERYPGKEIVMLTGDTVSNQAARKRQMQAASESNIIIMTFELLDSISRHYYDERYYFLREVGLLIQDEAHFISDSGRGDVCEAALMRFTKICPDARICFLSATMPNTDELAEWLTSLNGKETNIVSSKWRPVPLQMNYVEYPNVQGRNGRFDYKATQNNLEKIVVDIAMENPDDKYMIFVHAKNTGRSILSKLKTRGEESFFHNADLEYSERREIEDSFADRESGIRVLVSTSTTAVGVNLPAKRVIIAGVKRGIEEVDSMDLQQELGRCGRPQFDTEAHGYLLVPQTSTWYWKNKIDNPRAVTSVINEIPILAFHILAEINSGEIRKEDDIWNWYKRTLAYKQNPNGFRENDLKFLLTDLSVMKMIKIENEEIKITNLGRISANLYYSPYDISDWHKNFTKLFHQDKKIDDLELAWAIANIKSFDLNYVPKEISEECDTIARSLNERKLFSGTKIHMVLATHYALQGNEENGSLGAYIRAIRYDIPRMIQAIKLIDTTYSFWRKDDLWSVLPTRIIYGIPEYLIGLVRIPGVGGSRAKKLWDAGIKSVSDVIAEENKGLIFQTLKPKTASMVIEEANKMIGETK